MDVSAGKEDPVEFDSSLMLCSDMWGVAQVGGECQTHQESQRAEPNPIGKRPGQRHRVPRCKPAVKYHYLHRRFTHRVAWERWPFGHRLLPRGGVVALPRFVRKARVPLAGSGDPGSPPSNQKPRDIDQLGSLAGAARLLHHNAGVLKHCSDGTELSRRGEGQRCC